MQDRLSVPGPWYSTMAPVPPLTVRIPATLRIMSVVDVSACYPTCSKQLRVRTLGSSPARQLTSQLDTNDLGSFEFPGKAGHDVDSVSTTNTNGGHTKTTSVGSVRISTDEESTRESVVLEHNLVDDTRAGLPETNVVLCARGGQEVVDFLVDLVGAGQILLAADLSLDEMVAVDSGRGSNGGHSSRHELEDGHLGSGILAGHTVGTELEVADTTLNLLTVRVVQVRVENLLGKGEGAVETRADNAQVLAHLLVVDVVALFPVGHLDLAGEGSIADGGQLPARSKALAHAAEPRELLHGEDCRGGCGGRSDGGSRGKEGHKAGASWAITNSDHEHGDWLV